MINQRRLEDLRSVGPATIADLNLLGIRTVGTLAKQNAGSLYRRLCEKTGQRHDSCCEDVFAAAIAQAKNPLLPPDQREWWYWSRRRKGK